MAPLARVVLVRAAAAQRTTGSLAGATGRGSGGGGRGRGGQGRGGRTTELINLDLILFWVENLHQLIGEEAIKLMLVCSIALTPRNCSAVGCCACLQLPLLPLLPLLSYLLSCLLSCVSCRAHNPSRDAASLLVAQAGAAARQGKVGSSSSSGAGNSSSRAAGKAAGGGCTKRARQVGGSSSGSGSGTARAHKRAVGASGAAAHARSRRRRSAVDDDAPDEAAPFEMGEAQQAALDAGVAALQELGFSRPKALDALMECGCDVELAAEYLASTCC